MDGKNYKKNIDDPEYLSYIAKQYKIDTKSFDKTYKNFNEYRKNNIKTISKGRKIVNKINKNNKKIQLKLDNKNALKSFNNELSKLEKNGRGNDIDAIIKLAAKYDSDRNKAKKVYKSAKNNK